MPRYALWLAVQEAELDPDELESEGIVHFLDAHLDRFLREVDLELAPRVRAGLRRRMARYDPRVPTPYETMQRIFDGVR